MEISGTKKMFLLKIKDLVEVDNHSPMAKVDDANITLYLDQQFSSWF